MTAKSENSRNSSGSIGEPSAISDWLKRPLRPRKGIQEIMRMTFEVQNGTVQSRKSAICQQQVADVEDEEVGDREADDERDRPDDPA